MTKTAILACDFGHSFVIWVSIFVILNCTP
jgi:hypothetical protein